MPIGIGKWNPFPMRFGGGESIKEIEHQALLDAYAPGWDRSEGTANYADAMGAAIAVTMIWAINKRLANQAIPSRMLENLTTWEETLKLRPSRRDSDQERRARVAAKLRGIAGNTVGDIADACRNVLGDNYVDLLTVDTSNVITYWPGVNPGPPGYEWCSNRAKVAIQITRGSLTSLEYRAKVSALQNTLDAMCPAWMQFSVGAGSSFIADVGILDQDFLS